MQTRDTERARAGATSRLLYPKMERKQVSVTRGRCGELCPRPTCYTHITSHPLPGSNIHIPGCGHGVLVSGSAFASLALVTAYPGRQTPSGFHVASPPPSLSGALSLAPLGTL